MNANEPTQPIVLAGVDLAWRPERNATAIAIGTLHGTALHVEHVHSSVVTLQNILNLIDNNTRMQGIAVDAPLIIYNKTGKRECERELTRVYATRKAGCHSSNLTLYPNAATVTFSRALAERGFAHLHRDSGPWQIECYPHPAIIEIFDLPERLAYKKGNVTQKRAGQIRLAQLLHECNSKSALQVRFHPRNNALLNPDVITALRGQALKNNEDALDAVISLVIAAHYALRTPSTTFGNIDTGYIYVPRPRQR